MGSEHHVRYQYMPDANWHGSLDEMKQILNATDPGAVSDAGRAYSAASDKFYNTRELLRRELPKLREAWTGKVAEEAIGKLEKLFRQADTMRTASYNIAASLTDHGEKLEWYKANQPGPGMFDGVDWGDVAAFSFGGLVGLGAKKLFMDDAEDKAATEFMTRLSGRTIEANNLMPVSVTDDNPTFGDRTDFITDKGRIGTGGGSGPGGGGSNSGLPAFQDSSAGSGGGGSHPKVPSLPNSDPYGSGGAGSGSGGAGSGSLPNGVGGIGSDGGGSGTGSGRLPSGVGGIGSDGGGSGSGLPNGLGNSDPFGSQGSRLASATPNLHGGGLDGLGTGGGGAGGGMSGFGGGGAGSGSGLASNGFGPGGAMGAGAGAGRGFGAGGTAAGTGRGAGAPMGGHGGQGRGEEERERSTWLTEDEDVWGGDADTAPPVIG